MAGEKDVPETTTMSTVLDSLPSLDSTEKDLTSEKDEILSNSRFSVASSGDSTSSIKGKYDNKPVGEHGVCYPGYGGNLMVAEGYSQAGGSYTGLQSDDGSLVYGTSVGVDGQSVGQQPYSSSSGYTQLPFSHRSETVPCYSQNSATSEIAKSGARSYAYMKSNSMNSVKTNGNAFSKFSKPIPHAHSFKPINKVPHSVFNFSSGFSRGSQPSLHYQKQYQKQGSFPQNGSSNYRQNGSSNYCQNGSSNYRQNGSSNYCQNGSANYCQNGSAWTENDRFKQKDKFSINVDASEITRGPRVNNSGAPSDSPVVSNLELILRRDQYNLLDFETQYENAKFYVIKSFSEDNVYKCIRYDVWSSTAYGNRKLDAAFHDAEAKANETGTKCPIFLFFSVNGSGQFLGCAEMIGKVDFNKDMDFWKLDKWNGFFPVKWHIVKDVPNAQLRHIILENSDDRRDVTYTRDTQEIGLKQGLEMLKIFKNYSAKTSLLDDFNFYEIREKSVRAKKSSKAATQQNGIYMDANFPKHIDAREMNSERRSSQARTSDPTSLVNLTRNLSLDAGEGKI